MHKIKLVIYAGFVGVILIWIFSIIHSSNTETPVESEEFIQFIGGNNQHLGTIKKNERKVYTFTFKNISKSQTAEIIKVKPSCGCLGATRASQNILLPGEEATIEATVVGHSDIKRVDESNYITLYFKKHPPVRIAFTFIVHEDVIVLPERIELGEVYAKDKIQGEILFQPVNWGDLDIKKWKSTRDYIQIDKIETIPPRVVCNYSSRVQDVGKYEDEIIIYTNAKIDSEIHIPVSWAIIPNIVITPSTLFLGNMSTENIDQAWDFTLKSIEGDPICIDELKYNQSIFHLTSQVKIGEYANKIKYTLSLTKEGVQLADKVLKNRIIFHTNKGEISLLVLGSTL